MPVPHVLQTARKNTGSISSRHVAELTQTSGREWIDMDIERKEKGREEKKKAYPEAIKIKAWSLVYS